MSVGYRIYKKVNRAPQEMVDRFAAVPVANIDDVMGGTSCVSSEIRPFNDSPMCGTAFTVKAPVGEGILIHLALDMAQPGDVIIVDANGCKERGLCGEGMYLLARKKGFKGFVIDGAIRDSGAARTYTDFPVYGRSVQCNAYKAANSGGINVPISVGGVVVFPGDIIRGDEDGIVVIRPKDAGEIVDKVEAFAEKDREKMRRTLDGTLDRSWVQEFFKDKNFEYLDKAWDED